MDGLGGGRHHHVDEQQHQGGQQSGTTGGAPGVLGLLVHGDGSVPAPVDEHGQQHPGRQGADGMDVEGIEPLDRGPDAVGRVAGVHLGQGHDGEDEEDDDLGAEQGHLGPGRQLDADVTDGRHDDEPDHADEGDPEPRAVGGDAVGAEEVEGVDAGDRGQVGHDHQVGHEDAPAGQPTGLRPDGPGHPGERRAAVGIGPVQVVVGGGDEEHGHEGQQHHRRRVEADVGGHEAEGGGQAVGGGGGGHPDDQARDHPERPDLEALPGGPLGDL